MALGEKVEITTSDPQLKLEIYKGHYATAHGHSNYYIDIANNKANLNQARAVAKVLAKKYKHTTMIDTILCLDGMEVIAACLASELTKAGYMNINSSNEIYILTPEHNSGSQLFFRDNTAPMINGKFVLIVAASVATGFTVKSAVESVNYYGGHPIGIASIFATVNEIEGLEVNSAFNPNDLPGYKTTLAHDCPMCKNGEKINALVNSFGCSLL